MLSSGLSLRVPNRRSRSYLHPAAPPSPQISESVEGRARLRLVGFVAPPRSLSLSRLEDARIPLYVASPLFPDSDRGWTGTDEGEAGAGGRSCVCVCVCAQTRGE